MPATMSPARDVFDNPEVEWIVPFDWTRDGQSIVVHLTRKDRTEQIGVVSVRDGSLRVLKSLEWRVPIRMFVSPDDRHVAFDLPMSETDGRERDVFVMALDGSAESAVVSSPGHDRVMGWSPDGRRLLFASERTGRTALWAVPVSNGRATGAAVILKPEIAAASIGITTSGMLFTVAGIGSTDVKTVGIDLDAPRLLGAPENGAQTYQGFNRMPDWSPDGKFLSYMSQRDDFNRVIVIKTIATGEARELSAALGYFQNPRWTADGQALIVKGKDLRGRFGIYRVDARTGLLQLLTADVAQGPSIPQLSSDGRRLYYWRDTGRRAGANDSESYVERDLQTGTVREIFRAPGPAIPALSPDGTRLVGVVGDPGAKTSTLVTVDVQSGERRELARLTRPRQFGDFTNWSPDGRYIVVPINSFSEGGNTHVATIPAAGGDVRSVDLGFRGVSWGIRVHPNGRQIAYNTGGAGYGEVWVVENFLR